MKVSKTKIKLQTVIRLHGHKVNKNPINYSSLFLRNRSGMLASRHGSPDRGGSCHLETVSQVLELHTRIQNYKKYKPEHFQIEQIFQKGAALD